MERSSITKWLFFGLAIFLFMTVGYPKLFGSKAGDVQPFTVNDQVAPPAEARVPEQICKIEGGRFRAELSTKGGTLKHLVLTDGAFEYPQGSGQPMDLVTTRVEEGPGAPFGLESRMPLRTDLRLPGGASPQVAFDDFDWKLDKSDGKSCTFTYKDSEEHPTTELTKLVSATGGPFELEVTLTVKNLAAEPKKHRLAIEQTVYRTKKETEGHLGRQSEFLTETMAAVAGKTERQTPNDFEPDSFKKKEFTAEQWRRTPGDARLVAVSSSYFSKLVIPLEGPAAPAAETQIEEYWNRRAFAEKSKDPGFGHVYRARLAYPEKELKPNEAVTYKLLSFTGPKDRHVLAALNHGATEVLNLGTFAFIAGYLIKYLYWLKGLVGTWGLAIVLLTLTIRTALFPLSLTQIKSSIAMRKLKPEMDAINEKYKDDAAQRGLAIQELWRKNKVTNPVLGCLPMLLQMPVWWALYTSLQTAVELYHEKFLWFADLSAPDKFYIVPIVLGASSFIQQKLMPPQGDPQQQKMMMYMMPAVFTFMMLFLPSGLGVYMLTNTWLGIGQQLLVERYLKAKAGSSGTIEVREKTSGGDDKTTPALGKGKARVRG